MKTPPENTTPAAPQSSLELLHALNAVALTLQQSIRGEQNVFEVFQKQVVALGMRGGISELDPAGEKLVFRTVAFTNPLRKLLRRFEKQAGEQAEGYSIPVEKVDVYARVAHGGEAVFVPDTGVVSAQVVPQSIRALVVPLLSLLGHPPGIFAPLVFEGRVSGMLNMVGPHLTAEDIPTMQAFANQIAVALENTRLVRRLQSANEQLEAAYEKTLEGWVQALDLRDSDTEGHTLRTAQTAMQLARAMGMAETDLPHFRRGALLHDIGKMAIPDSILRKPGPLDASEWQVMKRHPQLGYDWIASIDYLKPAAQIPLCHHEHWDGSGYGQGLHGEEIPLGARIFAIVDVWDAMRSERPYRPAIAEKEVLAYLRGQSGKLFDPRVVEAFFDMR